MFFLGLGHAGFLVNFISHPLLSGFTSGAAIIIIVSQLKHLFGLDIPRDEYLVQNIGNILNAFSEINYITLAIGIACIAVIFALKRFLNRFPAALAVIIGGILVTTVLDLPRYSVDIVGDIPSGLPDIWLPSFDLAVNLRLLPLAFTIAFVGYMGSIAVSKH